MACLRRRSFLATYTLLKQNKNISYNIDQYNNNTDLHVCRVGALGGT